MNLDEDTHKIYGYVTKEEFYAGLNEAKKENLFVDEKSWVDIGALVAGMWKAFGEGRMVVVPREGFKCPEKKPTKELDKSATEPKEECHCSHCEVERDREKNRVNGEVVQKEYELSTDPADYPVSDNVAPPKKRPSKAKAKKKEVTEPVTE